MGGTSNDLVTPWRGIALILATFAIALKLMIPAGFMAAPAGSALAFALVICTDQGLGELKTLTPGGADRHSPDKAPAAHDKPCVFAGHGAALSPPLAMATAATIAYAPVAILPEFRADLAPGRGLAAPPPPSRGPPTLLT